MKVCRWLVLAVGVVAVSTVGGAEDEIEQLMRQLGGDRFRDREEAAKALEKIGEPALGALKKAARNSTDAEVRRRAADLVRVIEARWEVRRMEAPSGCVIHLAASPDGKRVLSAGSRGPDGAVAASLWDVASGKELRKFPADHYAIHGVAFSPDGKRALTAGDDRLVRVWDVETGREVQRFTGHRYRVLRAVFTADGKQVISASDDAVIYLWDVASGEKVRKFSGHSGFVQGLALSPDGEQLLSGGYDNTARL